MSEWISGLHPDWNNDGLIPSELPEQVDLTRYRAVARGDNATMEEARRLAQLAVRCGFQVEGVAAIVANGSNAEYVLPLQTLAASGLASATDRFYFHLRLRNANGHSNKVVVGKEYASLTNDRQVSDPAARLVGFIERAWGEIAGEQGELNKQLSPAEAQALIPGLATSAASLAAEQIRLLKV